MKRIIIQLVFGALIAQLAGCSSTPERDVPEYHTVRSGETLYSIARSYGLDHRQVASWNRLGDGSLIRVGQRLQLQPPGQGATNTARSAGTVRSTVEPVDVVPAPPWVWPTSGRIYLGYGQSPKTASGIRIAGNAGQPILAAAAGEIVYAGSGLASYGKLLIIRHNQSWLSAYGFNSVLLVREGDKVTAGQTVAEMGQDSGGTPLVHFEIRRAGQPVDPLRYLPPR